MTTNAEETTMHNDLPPSSRLLRRADTGLREGTPRHAVEQQLLEGKHICLALGDMSDPRSTQVERKCTAIHDDGREEVFTHIEQKPHYVKNYAVVAVQGPFAPKLVLHGRDILPTKEQADKLEAGAFGADDWKHMLRADLVAKAERLFSNDTFEDRLIGYAMPQDIVGMAQMMVQQFKQQYPSIDFSDLPEITEQNVAQVLGQMMLKAERLGLDSVDMFSQLRHPPESIKQEIIQHIKANADASYDVMVQQQLADSSAGLREEAMRRKPEVLTYMAQHRHDPEIVMNYLTGLKHADDKQDALPKLVKDGQELRACFTIIEAAKKLDNPYKPLFLEAEKKVARVAATSVQPKALRNAIKRKMAFMVTDADYVMPLKEALVMPVPGMWGKHEPLQPLSSSVFTDIIALSAPALDEKRLAWLMRHETEHSVDLSHGVSFGQYYKDTLKEVLTDDRAQLSDTYDRISAITPRSPSRELRYMQKLAKLLKLEGADKLHLSDDDVMRMKERVEHFVAVTSSRVSSFLPEKPGSNYTAYQIKAGMLAEVPAVIEELNGVLGQPFVKEVLPRMYEACRMHRSQHPHFRQEARQRREESSRPERGA